VASQPAPAEAPVLRARKGRVTQPAPMPPLVEEAREDLAVVVGRVTDSLTCYHDRVTEHQHILDT